MKTTLLLGSEDSITEKGVEGSATSLVPKGSILTVVRSGILAHTVPFAVAGRPLTFNQDIKAIQVADTRVSSEYVYWFLRSREVEILTRGVKKGATVHSLQSGFLENLRIPLLPDTEQRRMVELLSRAENIVRMRREAEAKAKEIIPALFVDMFGDPESNPKGWDTCQIERVVANTKLGLVRGAKDLGDTRKYPYVRMDAVQGGLVELQEYKRADATPKEVSEYALARGDFLFNTRNSRELVGKTGLVSELREPVTLFNNNLMRIRFYNSVCVPDFVAAQFQFRYIQDQLESRKRGTTSVFAIYYKDFKSITLRIPSLSLQRDFSMQADRLREIAKQSAASTATAELAFQSVLAGVFGEGK